MSLFDRASITGIVEQQRQRIAELEAQTKQLKESKHFLREKFKEKRKWYLEMMRKDRQRAKDAEEAIEKEKKHSISCMNEMAKARRHSMNLESLARLANLFLYENGGMLLKVWKMFKSEREARMAAEMDATALAEAAYEFGSYALVIRGERYEGPRSNHPPTNDYMEGFDEKLNALEAVIDKSTAGQAAHDRRVKQGGWIEIAKPKDKEK